MKRILLICITAGAAFLTSCVDPYYGQNAGYPQGGGYPSGGGYNGGGYGGSSSQAYRSGQTDGARDKSYNRPYNPYRGQTAVAPPFQDSYRNGYATGYRNTNPGGSGGWGNGGSNGGWGGNNGGWGSGSTTANERIYSYGNQCGLNDRRSGTGFNPAQYNANIPASDQVFFNKGYLAGWNGKIEQR